jgi:hypothetical protein
MPDRAVLDEITEQTAEVFDVGNNNQRKPWRLTPGF